MTCQVSLDCSVVDKGLEALTRTILREPSPLLTSNRQNPLARHCSKISSGLGDETACRPRTEPTTIATVSTAPAAGASSWKRIYHASTAWAKSVIKKYSVTLLSICLLSASLLFNFCLLCFYYSFWVCLLRICLVMRYPMFFLIYGSVVLLFYFEDACCKWIFITFFIEHTSRNILYIAD